MPPMTMVHTKDPAKVLLDKIGMTKDLKIPGFELFGNRVLVALYERPEKTAGGVILTEKYRADEKNQGKAGLVVAKGPSSFKSDANFDFGPDKLEIGDWCLLFISMGLQCAINGVACRMIRDQDIAMKIPMPDQIW
jgi:co-chaperonin GroES (HSP10)